MKRLSLFVAAALLLATSAFATSYSGTLTAPVAPGTNSSIGWSGNISGVTGEEGQAGVITPICTSQICDVYTLTVNVPSTFYTANPNYAVHVQTSATANTSVTDIDVYVYDSAGNLVCSSTSPQPSEDADCGALPAGTYEIDIAPLLATNQAYTGTVILEPEPATTLSGTGIVRYRKGNATFSGPVQLTRPNNVASNYNNNVGLLVGFHDGDGEPRVVHDPLGNLYVAATQGVPAGSDMWSSTDGGATWQYLGEPDGAQAANVITGLNGNGLGGGDEDLLTLPNGQVDMTSLWLGSNTTCVSPTGGHEWACNPNGNMLPADDRQWLANDGQNIVYITTKQVGAFVAGPTTLYVAKSTDGGVTFPYVSLVANAALLGLDPGDQGNIIVDRNHNVYNVFFDSSGQRLYVAKSVDGGNTWMNKLVYQAPACTQTLCVSLVHVFASIAADSANNLYIVFSDGTNSLYTSSSDGGVSWRAPTVVNSGAGVKTSMEPWVVAGDAGKINVFYYGTTARNFMDTSANWYVYMAQSTNALARVPTFANSVATPYVIHTGPICTNGTGCPQGTRTMLEYFFPDTFLDGSAEAVYPDSIHKTDTTAPDSTAVWFIKQTGGTKIIGR